MGTKRQIIQMAERIFLAVVEKGPTLIVGEMSHVDSLQQRCLDVASRFYDKARAYGTQEQRKAKRICPKQEKKA